MKLETKKLQNLNPLTNCLKYFASIVAKVILRFDLKPKQFYELLLRSMVIEGIKKYPKYNNSQLAGRIGIDRRYISEFSKTSEDFKPHAREKDIQVMNRLMTYFYKTKSNRIPKKNPFLSFESICTEVANGSLTPDSIATELLRRKFIVDGGSYYEINIERDFSQIESLEHAFNCFNEGTDRLLETIDHNLSVCAKDDNDKDCHFSSKLIQRSVSSTRIPEEYHQEVMEKLQNELSASFARSEEILSVYEDKSGRKKRKRIGAQYLSFKDCE